MEIESTTLLMHGSYVAFVFAVVLFGALAFRQISDNLAVRRLRMGEDRMSFVSAPGVIVATGGLLVTAIVGSYLIANPVSKIYFYALPLILVVQFSQVLLRVYLQRTLVRTRGFVLRSIAFERIRAIPFELVVRASLVRYVCWTKVTLTTLDERFPHVTFRIFPFSEPALLRILHGWCDCDIQQSGIRSANTKRRTQ